MGRTREMVETELEVAGSTLKSKNCCNETVVEVDVVAMRPWLKQRRLGRLLSIMLFVG